MDNRQWYIDLDFFKILGWLSGVVILWLSGVKATFEVKMHPLIESLSIICKPAKQNIFSADLAEMKSQAILF